MNRITIVSSLKIIANKILIESVDFKELDPQLSENKRKKETNNNNNNKKQIIILKCNERKSRPVILFLSFFAYRISYLVQSME